MRVITIHWEPLSHLSVILAIRLELSFCLSVIFKILFISHRCNSIWILLFISHPCNSIWIILLFISHSWNSIWIILLCISHSYSSIHQSPLRFDLNYSSVYLSSQFYLSVTLAIRLELSFRLSVILTVLYMSHPCDSIRTNLHLYISMRVVLPFSSHRYNSVRIILFMSHRYNSIRILTIRSNSPIYQPILHLIRIVITVDLKILRSCKQHSENTARWAAETRCIQVDSRSTHGPDHCGSQFLNVYQQLIVKKKIRAPRD